MKPFLYILLLLPFLAGCAETEDEKAAPMMMQIRSFYANKEYGKALDSITSLRIQYPKAVQSRKEALSIWQNASLKMAQEDIGKTDSLLQTILHDINNEPRLYRANMLRVKRDSLKARYDALCGVVRMIHYRQDQRH